MRKLTPKQKASTIILSVGISALIGAVIEFISVVLKHINPDIITIAFIIAGIVVGVFGNVAYEREWDK